MARKIDEIKPKTQRKVAKKAKVETVVAPIPTKQVEVERYEIPQVKYFDGGDSGRPKRGIKFEILIPILILILAGGFWALSHFDRTFVEIIPRAEEFSINQKITTYKNPNASQFGFDIMAVSETGLIEVSATERKEMSEKASGKIVIYNKYSTSAQKLAPETRFESADGKIFKLGPSGITVPGKKASGEPGSVEAMVYAALPGEEYNIPLTDFTIPGFKESGATEQYKTIYALSKTPMSGGSTGFKMTISDADRLRAENEIKNRLKEKLINSITRQKTDRFELVDGAIQFTFGNSEIIEESGKTYLKQSGMATTVLVAHETIKDFLIKTKIGKDIGDGIEIADYSSLKLTLEAGSMPAQLASVSSIQAEISGKIQVSWLIDTEKFAQNILNMGREEAIAYASQNPGIYNMTLKIRPFWQENTSFSRDKVVVELKSQ